MTRVPPKDKDGVRWYGNSVGSTRHAEDKTRCAAEIGRGMRIVFFGQCLNKRTHGEFCARHAPVDKSKIKTFWVLDDFSDEPKPRQALKVEMPWVTDVNGRRGKAYREGWYATELEAWEAAKTRAKHDIERLLEKQRRARNAFLRAMAAVDLLRAYAKPPRRRASSPRRGARRSR